MQKLTNVDTRQWTQIRVGAVTISTPDAIDFATNRLIRAVFPGCFVGSAKRTGNEIRVEVARSKNGRTYCTGQSMTLRIE